MTRSNKSYISFTAILFISVFFFSCKTAQKGTYAKLEEKTPQFLFQQMNDSTFRCDWLTGKLTATVEMEKKVNTLNATVRLRKDSVIWLSISALGIEVVRALITKDSLKMIDKMNGKYQVASYEFLDQILQMSTSFEMIQQLLLGNHLSYVDVEKLNSSKTVKNNYVLSTLSKRKIKKTLKDKDPVMEELWLNPGSFRIEKMFVDDSRSKREIEVFYNDFRRLDTQMFPYKTEFYRHTKDPISIKIDYSKVTLNKQQVFPFVVPENYKVTK